MKFELFSWMMESGWRFFSFHEDDSEDENFQNSFYRTSKFLLWFFGN